jgi:hypothetical protein
VGSGILSRGKCVEVGVEEWGGEAPVDDEGLGSELMACASRGGVSDMVVFKERWCRININSTRTRTHGIAVSQSRKGVR